MRISTIASVYLRAYAGCQFVNTFQMIYVIYIAIAKALSYHIFRYGQNRDTKARVDSNVLHKETAR